MESKIDIESWYGQPDIHVASTKWRTERTNQVHNTVTIAHVMKRAEDEQQKEGVVRFVHAEMSINCWVHRREGGVREEEAEQVWHSR